MNVTEAFSKRLKELRGNMSQEQLAKKLGVSRGSISFYENGDRTPDILFLDSVSKYFEVSTDYLLGYSEAKNDNNINISKELHLSDKSIENLRNIKNSLLSNFILNFILENKKMLSLLIYYLASDFRKDIRKDSNLQHIPISKHRYFFHQKIMFSEIIEFLPILRDIFYEEAQKKSSYNELLWEYLSLFTDIDQLKKDVAYFQDESDPLQEDISFSIDDIDDIGLFEKLEEDQSNDQEDFYRYEQIQLFKCDFLDYCLNKTKHRQNKGGEQNANDHTEERDI